MVTILRFIGFAEGDGAFLKDKHDNISFVITLIKNESKVLYHIKDILGFGKVTFDLKANTYRYKVLDISSLFKLALLFNGNLFLSHRINQLGEWIRILNSKSYSIAFNNINISISLPYPSPLQVASYFGVRGKLPFPPKATPLTPVPSKLPAQICGNTPTPLPPSPTPKGRGKGREGRRGRQHPYPYPFGEGRGGG